MELALIDEVAERGYRGASIDAVCERAGTDRDGFRAYFSDLEDGFCQIFETTRDKLLQTALSIFLSQQTWRDQIRAVAYMFFDFVEADRRLAHFIFVDVLEAGERAQRLRDEGTEALQELIDLGRQELEDPDSLSKATAQAVAGGIYQQMRVAIQSDAPGRDLVPRLMYNVVLPYVGQQGAAEELTLPPPAPDGERPGG